MGALRFFISDKDRRCNLRPYEAQDCWSEFFWMKTAGAWKGGVGCWPSKGSRKKLRAKDIHEKSPSPTDRYVQPELVLLACGRTTWWQIIMKIRLDCWEPVALQKQMVSHLDCIGRTDADANTPVLWPADENSWLIGKDPDARKDWRQKEKRAAENQIIGWHHWLSGYKFQQTPGDSEGQGILVCCRFPWGHKESNMT